MSTTITSLLNSLHTHLQSQTQLLPTLHAQLGLPPTALTDELASLQERLAQCIETQIDVRRKQVEEWMEKCAEVEEECLRYGRALGGHAKATPGSVGEHRKEQILPKRFEAICHYQEKLRQLYHSKLEQLLTITGRLKNLSRTLGPSYFPHDILEPIPAIVEDEDDPTSHRDVTPERFSRLEKELVRGKGEVNKRLVQLSSSMIQIDWLYTELGMTPPEVEDLSAASSSTLAIPNIARSTSSCSNRSTLSADPFLASSTSISISVSMSTPTPAHRGAKLAPPNFLMTITDEEPAEPPEAEYQRVFARFVARMDECADEELAVSVGLEGVDPTPGLLAWAENTRENLEDVKRRREAHIQTMYDQLEALWRRLGVTDAEMDTFVEMHRGSTETTLQAYEEELERMLELKREMMGTFVENARKEIEKLWDELMIGDDERADFAPFFDDEHTEELLSIHEEEIRRLKEERRAKGPLLASIKKYFDICEDEKELAAAASDQSRLLGRGPRDPGRLLREEKMRKRVTKEKPRLEQDLLSSIPAWEAETGRPFLVHGRSMLQLLMETASASDKENSNKRTRSSSRAGSAPPRQKTPSNVPAQPSNGHHMPLPAKSTTPAVRSASSMAHSQSAPRRTRLGESTSSYNNSSLGNSRGPSADASRPRSPSKGTGKAPALASSSSLPRPTIAMPVPRPGTAHHALGHGRTPTRHAHSYHPYPTSGRATSTRSTSRRLDAAATRTASCKLPLAPANTQSVLEKKASRARRESFKPRPSVDENWVPGLGALGEGARRYAGFGAGPVKEEVEG